MIVANDATVKGGAYFPMTVKKHLRAQEIALENRLPCIYLVDSGGANLPHQAESFPTANTSAASFSTRHTCPPHGIPQIACVMGVVHGRRRLCARDVGRNRDCAQSRNDLSRRPAAGEGRDRRSDHRGGTRRRGNPWPQIRHGRSCRRERSARVADRARDRANSEHRRQKSISKSQTPRPPKLDPQPSSTASCRKMCARLTTCAKSLRRIVDDSEMHEFKSLYGTTLVCGFARIWGIPVAILANNGILFSESALKGAHFIELACQRRIPLAVSAEHFRFHGWRQI